MTTILAELTICGLCLLLLLIIVCNAWQSTPKYAALQVSPTKVIMGDTKTQASTDIRSR